MVNLKNLNKPLDKILFVCYSHGCGGENLSYRISLTKNFRTLEVRQKHGRTVIKNDIFDKKFLDPNKFYNFRTKKDAITSLATLSKEYSCAINDIKQFEVVPSHFLYKEMLNAFPNNRYVVIQNPTNMEDYLNTLYKKVWCYKTNNFQEIVGGIRSRLWSYKKVQDKKTIDYYTKLILSKYKNLNFGQIDAVINDFEPTNENVEKLFDEKSKILRKTLDYQEHILDEKVYLLPYEKVQSISVDEILNYFSIDSL